MYYNAYVGYVKKEDAKELLKRRGIMSWVFVLALAIVFGILHFTVAPRMFELSIEFGLPLPAYADPTIRMVVFAVVTVALLVLRPEPDSVLEEKLRHYKAGEMILINKLVNYRYEMTLFGLMLAAVLYIILSIVLPIYSMTSAV